MDLLKFLGLSLVVFILQASGLTPDELDQFKPGVLTLKEDNIVVKSDGVPAKQEGVHANVKPGSVSFEVPFSPSLLPNDAVAHLPEGVIGVAIDGVPIHNPYTTTCCDAGLRGFSELDACWGKKDSDGTYYYDVPPLCLFKNVCNETQIVGLALDGFPIYGPYDELGGAVTSDQLDACHGRFDRLRSYRYHLTTDFPYVIGCFRAAPLVPQSVSCTGLVSPCPDGTQAPLPFHASDNHITNLTCCADENNCDVIKNPYYSSAISPLYGHFWFGLLLSGSLSMLYLYSSAFFH